MLDHLHVVGLVDAIDLHGLGFVDQVEQSRKGIAQADATTATVADVIDPFEFGVKLVVIPVVGVLPIDGMTRGRLEAAFPCNRVRHGERLASGYEGLR